METISAKQLKQTFIEDNPNLTEIQSTDAKIVEGFPEINPSEDEVWLLQCPKGYDIQQLENRKLKLPGRIKMKQYEAVALETPALKTVAFGYSNRKHRYGVKILPVTGKIVLRENLTASDVITQENINASCPSSGPVPLPECIKLRHPLLGAQYEKYMKLDKDIMERLQARRDTTSTKNNKIKSSAKKLKTSPLKRVSSPAGTEDSNIKTESPSKSKRAKLERKSIDVSEDLQWLKKL